MCSCWEYYVLVEYDVIKVGHVSEHTHVRLGGRREKAGGQHHLSWERLPRLTLKKEDGVMCVGSVVRHGMLQKQAP